MSRQHTNRLINEKSPYLLQHSLNPVDWFPWGDEAFEKAKKENKPIFLSIGYATCHWCHVMERESFENDSVAAYLNEHFVAIKVDREERPDLDMVYMTAVRTMTGQGGWPLSVFLTPDLEPFYGGTYFPPENRHGLPGFSSLLVQIHNAWQNKKTDLLNYANQLNKALNEAVTQTSDNSAISIGILDTAYYNYASQFDSKFGGFGNAPKFPRPMDVQFLLRYYHGTKDKKTLEMATLTLDKMAAGGMYDHLGGGFHRYSTDERWLIPHFEKMLYDNALLAIAYTEAYTVTHNPEYKRVVSEILDFVQREMTDKNGGFYSAQDADSEGEEGKYYVWTNKEIAKVLDKKDYRIWSLRYGVTESGNFEHKTNVFFHKLSKSQVAQRLNISEPEVVESLLKSKKKLLKIRDQRIKPITDDKILTNWNALMISAFTRAFVVFQEPGYLTSSKNALNFILDKMSKKENLLHRYRDGEAKINGFLDDYAFLIQACIDYYEVTFDLFYLKKALFLLERANGLFLDKNGGGYYFSAKNEQTVLLRMKDSYDGAIPSGNSMMALNLSRLAEYTMEESFQKSADEIFENNGKNIKNSPLSFSQMLIAIDFSKRPVKEIVLALPGSRADGVLFFKELNEGFYPNKVIARLPNNNKQEWNRLIPWTKDRPVLDGKTTVYICRNFTCLLPTTEVAVFAQQLREETN